MAQKPAASEHIKMELPEKLESALVAYLKTLTWPDSLKDSEGNLRIFPGESDADKDGQCVPCIAGDSEQEDPPFSGNQWFTPRLELRTPAGTADSTQLADHKAAAEVLKAGIQISDLKDRVLTAAAALAVADAPNFGDLVNFTIFGIPARQPIREQADTYFMSGYALRIYCASIAA